MNGPEHQPTPTSSTATNPDSPSLAPLKDQLKCLQTSLIAALLALILLSAAFCLFLFRQVSLVRKDLDACNLAVQEYQTKRGPFITNLVFRLQLYAQGNPDFIPILEKYGVAPASAPRLSTPLSPTENRK